LQKLASNEAPGEQLADVIHKTPWSLIPMSPCALWFTAWRRPGSHDFRSSMMKKSRKLVGIISLDDLLRARVRNLDEERRRERVLRIHLPFAGTEEMEEAQGSGVSNGSTGGSSESAG